MNEDELLEQAQRLKNVFKNIRAACSVVMHEMKGPIATSSAPLPGGILHSEPVVDMLRSYNVPSGDGPADNDVFTLLVPVNREGEFVLIPGSFSPGWHREHSDLVKTVTQNGVPLPPGEGLVWYGNNLFQHRFHLFYQPEKFTFSDNPYREITAVEFLIKTFHSSMYRLLEDDGVELAASFGLLKRQWAEAIQLNWDTYRIPGVLVHTKDGEFDHFLTIDRESLELFVGEQKLRMENRDKMLKALSELMIHYLTLFRFLVKLDSRHILEREPDAEAVAYYRELKAACTSGKARRICETLSGAAGTGNLLISIPDSWFDWLLQTSLLFLARTVGFLKRSDLLELFGELVRRMDVRTGRFSKVLPLQNLRVTPLYLLNEIRGLAVSRFRFTALHELDGVSNKALRNKVVLQALEDVRRTIQDFYLRCIQKITEETEHSRHRQVETYQKREVAKESVWRFCNVNPGVFCEDDRFSGYPELMGRGASMQVVYERIQKAAASDQTVLVTGKTGTGKELVARAVHRLNARRRKGTFVPVNCAALPANLLESELFGYEKGAFTGADRCKKGCVELADKGTLLLDEIGEMCLELQAKLLRVIQFKTFRRVGGTSILEADVLIVASTNQRLRELVSEKRFREDLYYRLNVLPIHVPELKDRPEDIPLLFNFFVQREQERGVGSQVKQISKQALRLLMGSGWPGNVRQLESCAKRILSLYIESGRDSVEPGDVEMFFEEEGLECAGFSHVSDSGAGPEVAVNRSVNGTLGRTSPPELTIFDIETEVRRWLEKIETGEVENHLDIIGHYEKRGTEVYRKLFETVMEEKKLNQFLKKAGMLDQYRAIRNKLHHIRKEPDREEV